MIIITFKSYDAIILYNQRFFLTIRSFAWEQNSLKTTEVKLAALAFDFHSILFIHLTNDFIV
jgi:hypothetical protein